MRLATVFADALPAVRRIRPESSRSGSGTSTACAAGSLPSCQLGNTTRIRSPRLRPCENEAVVPDESEAASAPEASAAAEAGIEAAAGTADDALDAPEAAAWFASCRLQAPSSSEAAPSSAYEARAPRRQRPRPPGEPDAKRPAAAWPAWTQTGGSGESGKRRSWAGQMDGQVEARRFEAPLGGLAQRAMLPDISDRSDQ